MLFLVYLCLAPATVVLSVIGGGGLFMLCKFSPSLNRVDPPTHFTSHHQSTNSFIRTHALAKLWNVVEARKKGKTGVRFPSPLPHSNGLDWLEEIIPFRAIWNMCVFASVFKIYIDLITSKEATLTVLVETGSKLQSLP